MNSLTDKNGRNKYADRIILASFSVRRFFRAISSANTSLPVQLVKTLFAVILWCGSSPLYIHLIATFNGYTQAQVTVPMLAMFSGIAAHLWPTRTPPWRTVVIAAFAMMVTGIFSLELGAGKVALTLCTLIGFLVVVLRVNQNGRRLFRLIRTWREL